MAAVRARRDAVAAFVYSTRRATHAWLTRRPPVIIGAHGISVGFRETIPWTAVSGLYVGDESLSLKPPALARGRHASPRSSMCGGTATTAREGVITCARRISAQPTA